MIYITGDTHADFNRLDREIFFEQEEMTRDDFLIICGDFGGVWYTTEQDKKKEKKQLDWINDKPFTTLFIDGNHENFFRLNKYPEVDFHGGRAHKIADNIYHLKRGNVFELCDKKIFTFGGAASHDIRDGIVDPAEFGETPESCMTNERFVKKLKDMHNAGKIFRIKGLTWWPEEMANEEEKELGRKNLEKIGNKVDYIVTHCGPQEIVSAFSMGIYKPDHMTMYLNSIMQDVQFDRWFFGHYHDDRQIYSKFILLYEQIVRIA